MANGHSSSIQNTTKSVHAETVRVVDEQLKDLDVQMRDLDDFVTHARSHNSRHHAQHADSLQQLSSTVETSFGSISAHSKATYERVKHLGDEMEAGTIKLHKHLEPIEEDLRQPLATLREDISSTILREYEPTGDTPAKMRYQYPTELPRTASHQTLIGGVPGIPSPSKTTQLIFNDFDTSDRARSPSRPMSSGLGLERNPLSMSLREVNPNLTTGSLMFDPSASTMSVMSTLNENTVPLFKKSKTRHGNKHGKTKGAVMLEGRENVPLTEFSQSVSKRKSPRLN